MGARDHPPFPLWNTLFNAGVYSQLVTQSCKFYLHIIHLKVDRFGITIYLLEVFEFILSHENGLKSKSSNYKLNYGLQ